MTPQTQSRMTRTCVYLPDDLRDRLRAAAAARRAPMAHLIRFALESSVSAQRSQPAGGFLDERDSGVGVMLAG